MKYLADSDALFAAFNSADAHHDNAVKLLKTSTDQGNQLYICNLVLHETATVISYKINHHAAKTFHQTYPQLNPIIIEIDSEIEQLAWSIFTRQTKKGTSFIDCTNLAVLKHYSLDKIISFDSFYPKKTRISL